MKLKFKEMDQQKRLDLILCAGALLLLILALVFPKEGILSRILAVVSFLASLAALRRELEKAFRARDFRSGLLLLVIAGVISICVGKAIAAAAALLLWRVGFLLLDWFRSRVLGLLQTRKGLSPFSSELPEAAEEPVLTQRAEKLLNGYFTYLAILLAALIAVFVSLAGSAGIAAALYRAAVVLSLGGTFSLFTSFPLSDYAAILRAGESGVLFRRDSLTRLLSLQLAAVETPVPKRIGSAMVYPSRADAVGPELMMRLAIAACENTGLPAEEKLVSIVQTSFDEGEVKRQILPGYGVVARVRELTILAGSAEFMRKAGLKVVPFSSREDVLHLGVNGRYAGCIDFSESEVPEGALDEALSAAGFFRFRDRKEAEEKRLPGEELLIASTAALLPEGKPEDLSAGCGIASTEAQVSLERCGAAGVLAMLEQLTSARLGRKGAILVSVIIKAVLLLLTIFGVCPLWLAVLAELAVVAFSELYAVNLLDFTGKY